VFLRYLRSRKNNKEYPGFPAWLNITLSVYASKDKNGLHDDVVRAVEKCSFAKR
jgi:hypothetical protein